jgi:hypothetical protein
MGLSCVRRSWGDVVVPTMGKVGKLSKRDGGGESQ